MTTSLAFDPTQRWLVVAPHPDDEVLGTGGLLQRAVGAGAQAWVLLLTDGDNNPWPQRWIERSLRLDAQAQRRWGLRRRSESVKALACLGLDPKTALVPLGWPDGRIDELLTTEPEAGVSEFANHVDALRPTHLVLPIGGDRHPDHNASAVIALLALRRTAVQPRLLAYRVHGREEGATLEVELDAEQVQRKRNALEEHRTQLVLSRGRFMALASSTERFFEHPFLPGPGGVPRVQVESRDGCIRLRLNGMHYQAWRMPSVVLRVVIEDLHGGLQVRSVAIGTKSGQARFDRAAGVVSAQVAGEGARQVFAKLEPVRRGLWIYDEDGWCWSGPIAAAQTSAASARSGAA